jgi:hypothetical protein
VNHPERPTTSPHLLCLHISIWAISLEGSCKMRVGVILDGASALCTSDVEWSVLCLQLAVRCITLITCHCFAAGQTHGSGCYGLITPTICKISVYSKQSLPKLRRSFTGLHASAQLHTPVPMHTRQLFLLSACDTRRKKTQDTAHNPASIRRTAQDTSCYAYTAGHLGCELWYCCSLPTVGCCRKMFKRRCSEQ